MAMWRVRRIFSKPVAVVIVVSALLVWASGFFYAELKVWMYGPQHVLTVGSSGRGLCIRRMDYQGVMSDMFRPPPADTYWPDDRWFKAAWLGPRAYWVTEWFPKFVRQKHGWFLAVPWWLFAGAGVAFFVIVRCWPSRGTCRGCGYDLKGLRTRVCPECGKAFGA